MSEISVGSVSVDVVPDARRFPSRVAKQVNPEAAKIGQEFGRLFGASAEREMAEGVREGLREGGQRASQEGTSTGRTYGSAVKKAVKAETSGLTVGIDADIKKAEAKVKELRAFAEKRLQIDADVAKLQQKLAALQARKLKIDVDTKDAEANLETLRVEAEKATGDKRIKIDADISRVEAKLAQLRASRVSIDADTAVAEQRLDSLESRINEATRDRTVDVDANIAGAEAHLDRLRSERIQITADVDVDTAAASAQLALLNGQARGAGGGFSALLGAALLLGPALIPIGAVGAGAMAAIATGALAAVAGLGVLILALAPVIAAVQAVRQAHDKSAQSARGSTGAHLQMASAMDSVRTAQQGLKSAEADAADARIRSAESVANAERTLASAKRQGAQDAVDASRRVVAAERDVADAQRDALQAQRDLADARKQAARDAEDLAARVAGGVLDERDATLRLEEARQRAAAIQADPNATQLERDRAQLGVDQAIQGLKDQEQANIRLRAEKAATDKAGVDGSKAVVDAQERVRESQQKVRDAQAGVALAVEDASRRQVKSAESIADAQRGVADATRDAAQQQRRSAESIASASQAVVSAQRGVQQASQSAGASGGAAMDKVRDKMAALSPAGKKFVDFVNAELIPSFSGISKTAQEGFLPGFEKGIKSLMPLIPSFKGFVGDLAKTMGDLAAEAGKALNGPVFRKFFDYLDSDAGPIIESIAHSLGNFGKGFAGLIPAFKPITDQIFKGLEGLSKKFADFGASADTNSGFQKFLAYIKENGPKVVQTFRDVAGAVGHILASLAPLAPIVLSIVSGFARLISALPAPVIAGIVVALGALAIAIAVVNGAMALLALNPIVLAIAAVIAIIIGLAAAFVVAYKNSETFRDIVNAVWATVRDSISAAWGVIKGVWNAIGTFITVTLPAAFTGGVDKLKSIWTGFKTHVSDIWNGIKAIFNHVWEFIRDTVSGFFQREIDGLKRIWTGFKTGVSDTWNLIKVIFEKVYTFIRDAVRALFQAQIDGLATIWAGLKTAISSTWDGIKTIFSALGNFIGDNVVPAFKRGVEAIGKAWEGIKEAAKAPVRFVVGTVINGGIIDTFNKVAGFFKVDPVDHVRLPEGFATGGYVSGPGGPREDKIPAMLSDGEFVINAASTARNLDLLKYLNEGGSLGGDPSGVARFAKGGLVEDTMRWLPSVDPLPYVWGAVGPNAFDCSGLVGEVWNRVTDHVRNSRVFTTSSNLGGFGFEPGLGMFSVGVNPGQHMVGNLGGLGFEARSTKTGIFVGPSATSPNSMQQVFHLGALPGGGKTPDGISLLHPLDSFKALFAGALDGAEKFAGSPFGDLAIAMPKVLISGVGDFISDHIPGFADGGLVTKYDEGGYLPPGLTTVLNATGKPEPVFTSGQWRQMRSGGDKAPVVINQTVNNPIPETPSQSLTRSMRTTRNFGLIPQGG